MPPFADTYVPPLGGAPTSGPQGLGRIPINYLRLNSPTPRERSLTSPRLRQLLNGEGHDRYAAAVYSGTASRMDREQWRFHEEEGRRHEEMVEETMISMDRGESDSGPRIYRHADQLMTGVGQYLNPPRNVRWAEPIHTTPQLAIHYERERSAIRRNTRANAVKVSDAELAKLAEYHRVPHGVDLHAGIEVDTALNIHKNLYMRVHGQSCWITSISMHNSVIRIEVDLMHGGHILKVRPSDLVSVSSIPIPDGAITYSSANMLVERDYTRINGRPYMLTEVGACMRHMHVAGIDLANGEEVEADLPKDKKVSIAARPVGKFVPENLLGPAAATVPAASLVEGYYMVIEGRECRIVCVRYPKRPCKESCWRKVRVVGMDTLLSTENETVLRGVDLDMASMVTVGRTGIDPGPCDSTGEGNILDHMSCADSMYNNMSSFS